MPSPEEMAAWTFDDVRLEIRNLLPDGWSLLELLHPDGYVVVRLNRIDDHLNSVTEFEVENADHRLALLDAYGRLWLKARAPVDASPWVRRRELSREAVTRKVNFGSTSDPEDLDPQEIASVYRDRK